MKIISVLLSAAGALAYQARDYGCRFYGDCSSPPVIASADLALSPRRHLEKRNIIGDITNTVLKPLEDVVNSVLAQEVAGCIEKLMEQAQAKGLLNEPPAPDPKNPNVDDADCPNSPSASSPSRRLSKRDDAGPSGFDKCIPLVSQNFRANPYHPLLTGMDMEENVARLGKGASYSLLGSGIECPAGGCSIKGSYTVSIQNSKSLSINNGQDNMVSISNSTNWSSGVSSSEMKSVTDSLVKSNQHTSSSGTSQSTAKSVQDSLTKTHEQSTENTHSNTNQHSVTGTTTWEHDDSHNQGSEDGFNSETGNSDTNQRGIENGNSATSSVSKENTAEFTCTTTLTLEESAKMEIPFIGLGFDFKATQSLSSSLKMTIKRTATKTKESHKKCSASNSKTTSNSFGQHHNDFSSSGTVDRSGGATAVMNGHSETDSVSQRVGDSISSSVVHGLTNTEGFHQEVSDMYGVSAGHTTGTDTTRGQVDNKGGDVTNVTALTRRYTEQNTNTTTETRSRTFELDLTLGPGSCWIPVCRPVVKSVITPWLCRNDNDPDTVTIMTTELQEAVHQNPSQPFADCAIEAIPCDQQGKIGFNPFRTYRGPANEDSKKYLATGDVLDSEHFLENGQFRFGFLPGKNGGKSNLAVYFKNSDTSIIPPKWQSGILSATSSRLRITADGHLLQEAQGVFANEDWTTVWSNQPVNRKVPVGVYGKYGYRLYLSDQGELELVDGAEVLIWSTAKSTNKLGFKYPIENFHPTLFPTEPNFPGQNDPHNAIPSNLQVLPTSYLEKANGSNCSTVLNVNQAIKSSNGRFTLHLRDTGNLVLRDGSRIMWETKTSDLYYSTPPYRAILSDFGYFQVKDQMNVVLWQTEVGGIERFQVSDTGNLVGFFRNTSRLDPLWSMRWQEIPTALSSGWYVFEHPFVECDKCSKCTVDSAPAPLVHLATGKCVVNPWTNACEDFKLDPATKHYVSMNASSVRGFNCLGNTTSIYGSCAAQSSWRHYSDGFLTLQNFGNRCVSPSGKVIFCDENKLRTDKLFSHGTLHSNLDELSTKPGHNRFMLLGHTLTSNFGTNLTLHPNGDLLLKTKSDWKWKRSGTKLVYTPMIVLGEDGSLKITNLARNISDITLAEANGVGPYSLKIEAGLKGMAMLRDSRGLPLWKMALGDDS